MEAIRVESIVKSFDATLALDEISLDVLSGELFFLLGASGCGKTTLLRCIAGLEEPTQGFIYFGKTDVTRLPPHKREAAMVFQSYALWPHLTVAQNIAFGLEERRVPKGEIKRRVEEALDRVHLSGFGARSIDQMSGGQQQRVSLARALVVKPKCLLLDEPLSNLDAQLRIEMRREIRSIVKDNGLTAIYVTHDQEEALSMADRMAILDQGKIAQIGTPSEIYRNPANTYVARFIGETNLIPWNELTKASELSQAFGFLFGNRSSASHLSIRPEAWKISSAPSSDSIQGNIHDLSYLGQRILYWIDTSLGRQQVIELNPHQMHTPGTLVYLSVHQEDIVIL